MSTVNACPLNLIALLASRPSHASRYRDYTYCDSTSACCGSTSRAGILIDDLPQKFDHQSSCAASVAADELLVLAISFCSAVSHASGVRVCAVYRVIVMSVLLRLVPLMASELARSREREPSAERRVPPNVRFLKGSWITAGLTARFGSVCSSTVHSSTAGSSSAYSPQHTAAQQQSNSPARTQHSST